MIGQKHIIMIYNKNYADQTTQAYDFSVWFPVTNPQSVNVHHTPMISNVKQALH